MDQHQHDHSEATHSAKCDEQDCTYIAMTHAHDDEGAAEALSADLAAHNIAEHNIETNAEEIRDAVSAKMHLMNHE